IPTANSAVWATGNLTETTWYRAVVTSGVCTSATSDIIKITVQDYAVASDITLFGETICKGERTTLTPTTRGIINPVFRWYISQNATSYFYQGASYTTPELNANVTYYVSVFGTNICENKINTRKAVTVIAENCMLIDCNKLIDRFADEDQPRSGYTHLSTEWDVIPETILDNLEYFINGTLYSSGENASLNGSHFNVGVSTVTVYAYFEERIDSCEFKVTIERTCPYSVPDIEDNIYTVIKLAGLCWTENLKSTLYSSTGAPIPVAIPYTCPICSTHLDAIFGLLYDWYSATGGTTTDETVQGICPDGYHIPSRAEWNLLERYNAVQLMSTQYWLDPPGVGTDNYGFDARPAGWYNGTIDRYQDLFGYAGWWAVEDIPGTANADSFFISYYCNSIQKETVKKIDGMSVRCVMDY
ncbi:MAG: hypothetical protein FWF70_00550, partial [Bacteroidetes bacterium]|nr:hypothetical protein [Bacteroidota bacterium]